MARNSSLAYSRSPAMLSSQKMMILPRNEAYSAATSSTGRLRSRFLYITASVQKSQRLGQPRLANSTPLVKSLRWNKSFRAWGACSSDGMAGGLVDLLVAALLEVAQELLPQAFGFADKDNIRMLAGFLREQGDMRAAQHHRDPRARESRRPARRRGSALGVWKVIPTRSTRHEVDRADFFIDMLHLPAGRGQRSQVGHGDLLEIKEARPADFVDFGRGSGDEKEFHP